MAGTAQISLDDQFEGVAAMTANVRFELTSTRLLAIPITVILPERSAAVGTLSGTATLDSSGDTVRDGVDAFGALDMDEVG